MLARRLGPLLLALLLSLTLPASLARQLKAVEVPSPAAEEALLGLKSGGGGLAPDASGGLEGTTGTSYSSPLGYNAGSSGSDVAGGSGAGLGSGGDGTMPAVGGSEYDLVGTLFNGNSAAFTQAVLASGTSSAGIAVAGMLELSDPAIIATLKESLAGPEPGASAVAKAVTAGFQLAVCQSPERNQDATAAAISGGAPLASAAARGLARAAQGCSCSKVATHLAGAALSLEAGTSFLGDLDAALRAAGATLPACAVPTQLSG